MSEWITQNCFSLPVAASDPLENINLPLICRWYAVGNGVASDNQAAAASGDLPHAWKNKLAVGSWCYACGSIINVSGRHCSGVYCTLAD